MTCHWVEFTSESSKDKCFREVECLWEDVKQVATDGVASLNPNAAFVFQNIFP